jgi:hypothetical protein
VCTAIGFPFASITYALPYLFYDRTYFELVVDVVENDTYTFEIFCKNANFATVGVQITVQNETTTSSNPVLYSQQNIGGFTANFSSGKSSIQVLLNWGVTNPPNGPMSLNFSLFNSNDILLDLVSGIFRYFFTGETSNERNKIYFLFRRKSNPFVFENS